MSVCGLFSREVENAQVTKNLLTAKGFRTSGTEPSDLVDAIQVRVLADFPKRRMRDLLVLVVLHVLQSISETNHSGDGHRTCKDGYHIDTLGSGTYRRCRMSDAEV